MAAIAIILAVIGLLLLFGSFGLAAYWLLLQLRKVDRHDATNPIPIGEKAGP